MTKIQASLLQQRSGFALASKVRYLGIYLVQNNYTGIIDQINKDLLLWSKFQLLLLGRIAAIKMNVLPKILFLFQNLPILSSIKMINDLDKNITKFIWQNKKVRLRAKYLQDIMGKGGFALPNWLLYYQAASLV